MKLHKLFGILLVCVIAFSCKKNDDGETTNPESGAAAKYSLLLTTSNGFEALSLDADVDKLTQDPIESSFPVTTIPDLNFKDGTVFSFYNKTGMCSADFLVFDFANESSQQVNLFSDIGTCNLTAYAIAHNNDSGYVAYGLNNGDKIDFFVRAFELNGATSNFTDIPMTKKPIHLGFANNRLFVLTLDEEFTDENSLTVIDAETNGILLEMNLGYDAQKLIRNTDDNIIISYDELHTLLNSETLSPKYVRYQSGIAPGFVASTVNNFGEESRMYYERPSGTHSEYPIIPAAYDFATNLATLYPFEGYLTQQEREFEYKIETTTMVGYDQKNGYMLIGYRKVGQDNKGGILRVRTGENPAVIDNIDVDGIPFNIIAR